MAAGYEYVAPGIQRRYRTLYAVKEIPKALRKHFGRARFVQSLGTNDRARAITIAAPILLSWDAAISREKAGLEEPATLTSILAKLEVIDRRLKKIEEYV